MEKGVDFPSWRKTNHLNSRAYFTSIIVDKIQYFFFQDFMPHATNNMKDNAIENRPSGHAMMWNRYIPTVLNTLNTIHLNYELLDDFSTMF